MIFFGILVIPLGLAHVALIIAQPVVVGNWCFWCLFIAAIMLPMISLEVDEVAATVQSSIQEKRIGKSSWTAFRASGEPGRGEKDTSTPAMMAFLQKPGKLIKASIWGMSFPLPLLGATALGLWLMFAPTVFGLSIETIASNIVRIAGSLIIVISIISFGEVVRLFRFLNIPVALAIGIVPWFIADSNLVLNISCSISGLLVAGLSVPRGPKTQTYGMFDKYVK